jgi:hypothetical protein
VTNGDSVTVESPPVLDRTIAAVVETVTTAVDTPAEVLRAIRDGAQIASAAVEAPADADRDRRG